MAQLSSSYDLAQLSSSYELTRILNSEIDRLITSTTNQLIKASADQHDRLAGRIAGLGEAQRALRDLAKKFHLGDLHDASLDEDLSEGAA